MIEEEKKVAEVTTGKKFSFKGKSMDSFFRIIEYFMLQRCLEIS